MRQAGLSKAEVEMQGVSSLAQETTAPGGLEQIWSAHFTALPWPEWLVGGRHSLLILGFNTFITEDTEGGAWESRGI